MKTSNGIFDWLKRWLQLRSSAVKYVVEKFKTISDENFIRDKIFIHVVGEFGKEFEFFKLITFSPSAI